MSIEEDLVLAVGSPPCPALNKNHKPTEHPLDTLTDETTYGSWRLAQLLKRKAANIHRRRAQQAMRRIAIDLQMPEQQNDEILDWHR